MAVPEHDNEWVLLDPSSSSDDFAPISFYSPHASPQPEAPKDNIILVKFDDYLNDLYQGFHSNFQNVIRQFYLDVPREKIHINNYLYQDPKKIHQIINQSSLNPKTKLLLYMLSTQCAMCLPCQTLISLYGHSNSNSNSNPNYLGEIGGQNFMKVDIQLGSKVGWIRVKKALRIFHLEDNHAKTNFIIQIQLDFNVSESEYIVFSWKIV